MVGVAECMLAPLVVPVVGTQSIVHRDALERGQYPYLLFGGFEASLGVNGVVREVSGARHVYPHPLASSTWEARGDRPKLHLSSQDPAKQAGAHAYSVDLVDWRSLVDAFTARRLTSWSKRRARSTRPARSA